MTHTRRPSSPDEQVDLFERALADFSRAVDRIFRAAAEFDRNRWGEEAGQRLFDRIEVAPARRLRADEHYLLRSYDIFGERESPDARARREAVCSRVEEVDEVFATLEEGSFGAFRITFDGGEVPRAHPLNGLAEAPAFQLAYFGNPGFERLLTAGTYVGWLVEFEAKRALVLAATTDAIYHRRLSDAAERTPWGASDAFRTRDYEHDVLALLLDRDCVDTGRCEGRVFLSSALDDGLYLDRDRLRARVARRVIRRGLPGAFEPADDRRGPAPPAAGGKNRGDARGDHFSGRVANWSLEAALLADASFTAARDVLELYRRQCIPTAATRRAPLGDRSAEFLLPLDEVVELLGLRPDGGVDHPKVERADRYRLAVFGPDADRFTDVGMGAGWTIAQALGWARAHADPDVREALEIAVHRHRAAIRWAAIVDKNRSDQGERDQLLPITYGDLIDGLERLIPAALTTPLDTLDEPGRGTLARIEAGVRDQDDPGDEPVRLGDLPAALDRVEALPGVGSVSAKHLERALLDFVAAWPESMGHRAASLDDEHSTGDHLSEGLQELEGLF